MACYKCDGYWVCDAVEAEVERDCAKVKTLNWTYKWTQTLPAGTFHVWCRPGCDAKIAKQEPQGGPQWYDAGEIEDMEEGDYRLSCTSGGQNIRCQVKVEKV